MKTVWTVRVTTESSYHYMYVYAYSPTRKEVIRKLWEDEGKSETLKWYDTTTDVQIERAEVVEG